MWVGTRRMVILPQRATTMRSPAIISLVFMLAASVTIPCQALPPPTGPEVQAVYTRLCAAAGLAQGAPHLEFDAQSTRSAAAFTDFGTTPTRIVVEQKALDVCATFGPLTNDAVAFLLGHEIAHFSMGHGWGADLQQFGDHGSVKKNMEMAMANNRAFHVFETQADQKGAFYAFIAGYSPALVADSLIRRLYKAYGWNDRMSGYPDRPVREELLRKGLVRYQEMTMAMRLADHRLALGQYHEAGKLYELLMSEGFRNPMLYTNAGACHLLQAIQLIPSAEARFTFPVEIDTRERWRGALANTMEEELLKAEDHFLEALLMDRTSSSALANLACIALVRKDLVAADHWIGAYGKCTGAHANTGAVLQAILAAERGDEQGAKDRLRTLAAAGDGLAQRNLDALEGKPTLTTSAEASTLPEERIEGRTLTELATGFAQASPLEHRGRTLLRYGTEGTCWKMAADRIDAAGATHWLYLGGTAAGYTGKSSKGIAIGSPIASVTKNHGQPHTTLNTMEGQLLIYPSAGSIFSIDRDGRVSGWTLFQERKQ